MGDDQKPQDEAGPEEGYKIKGAVPDEDKDIEGHRARSLSPDAPAPKDAEGDKPGHDEYVRR